MQGTGGELVQKLSGHLDRVYAANFHPNQPVLATCGADATVKVWTVRQARLNSLDHSYSVTGL